MIPYYPRPDVSPEERDEWHRQQMLILAQERRLRAELWREQKKLEMLRDRPYRWEKKVKFILEKRRLRRWRPVEQAGWILGWSLGSLVAFVAFVMTVKAALYVVLG